MAESEIENNDFKKIVDMKETINDTTTSTNVMEDIEKQTKSISSKNISEEDDSCEKDFEIINIIDVKKQKKETRLEDSKTPEKVTSENEQHSEACPEEEVSSDTKQKEIDDKTEKSKQIDNSDAKAKDTHDATYVLQEEETLNELLKVVHENLSSNNACESDGDTKDSKKEDNTNNEETKEKVEEKSEIENIAKDVTSFETNVPVEDETTKLKEDSETKHSIETVEHMEVGIVGPPTTVSELINEELRAESALSTNQKVQDHVAEWVQNSAKAEELVVEEDEEEETPIREIQHETKNLREKRTRKKKSNDVLALPTRKSQRIVSNIIKKSIKCLNKMHAMEGTAGNGKKVDSAEKTREDDSSRASPKVPQSQQNGAALPEETAAAPATVECLRSSSIKKEPLCDSESEATTKTNLSSAETAQQKPVASRCPKTETEGVGIGGGRKRKSTDGQLSSNGNSTPKKSCLEQREQYITSLVGCEKVTAEELAARADQLRAEVQALDELARAKEMEWNEILSMRKLKEEAYLRIERRRQVMGFMEGNGQLSDTLPPASLALGPEWESSGNTTPVSKEKLNFDSKEDLPEESSRDSPAFKKEKLGKQSSQRQSTPPKQGGENGRKQTEALSPENRQIGEGRQGAIVDVRSIIADYRLRHPETVPRRGRRMRNSVNVGLGAGGAMVETGHSVDSRPSSTDSCKSNPNMSDPNSMSFKDVLVQFAKLSQQQGEPVKTPQNYPDVTLHPVAPSPAPPNTPPQQSCSLLHGILTKSQSPRPTTFSPTLARLLTAPERERNAPSAASMPQQSAATQHLLQAYQGSNPVSISDLLSSSKARTEITITPVVNTPVQSHSNNLIHVDDVEEESAVIEDRETRISSGGRDGREDRDSPPRCQGCRERAAQFVCAGCGNQWYCSRECQVAAWDEHSEVCSG
ncbi:actin cytoskeleton-regulatory complex protein pan1-like isoform X1 [Colletes gigas]|uniref:actin cytoskeleton-regulatory complex protein pan1-like isoform X1 n=1 Tax=Colletes gigas TaxID=935657 RepID=UPI001C9B397B|nr:actin cytoskeleton-regulatory complex protein pan1-like isoform X1 [Colletes gigas]XP_043258304.1 actin cytoskeleton-regulatory complex protein pan1-like isoform X1 [Colletes gigas]XP_043258305.1 actin cytoskeleton-regulatory complex protein pan1-like isoform X1 [Colletes gigas]